MTLDAFATWLPVGPDRAEPVDVFALLPAGEEQLRHLVRSVWNADANAVVSSSSTICAGARSASSSARRSSGRPWGSLTITSVRAMASLYRGGRALSS